MLPVRERPRMFDRITNRVAMDKCLPRDQRVGVRSREHTECQHGTHGDNRDADS
jgi:hypothetical protein